MHHCLPKLHERLRSQASQFQTTAGIKVLPHLYRKKLSMVACTCHLRDGRKLKIKGWESRQIKSETQCLK
jgi:hypothetical protein